jgi:hypothetical protein
MAHLNRSDLLLDWFQDCLRRRDDVISVYPSEFAVPTWETKSDARGVPSDDGKLCIGPLKYMPIPDHLVPLAPRPLRKQ